MEDLPRSDTISSVKKIPLSSIPPPPRPDRRISGRYELIEVAGRGGMAVVWRAVHHGPGRFRRPVAVKQMHSHLARQPLYRDLFEEEARVGSLLQDPNIAQVIDFVLYEGQYYLVLEWVSGVDFSTFIKYVVETRQERMKWTLVAAVGIGMLRGLAAAHARAGSDGGPQPIVHRDVSPHNILINDKGRAKLIDFGLSYSLDRTIDDTDPGMAKGKLAYLAPEIVRGGRPTPASDQFAAGSVLYEALVGKRAFEGENDYETYTRVANAEIEPLHRRRPEIPSDLCTLVHRALALDPADRFADANEMAHALGEILKGHRGPEDLYGVLARTVAEARADLGIGERTQDPHLEDSVPELESGLVELMIDDERPPKGFARWIPSFLRKRD